MSTKKQNLEDTGERMIPDFHGRSIMYAEHMTRYEAAKKLAKGKVVLDIASGSGYGTKTISEVAKKVYGVDVSEEAVKYAQQKFGATNIEYLVGDAEKIPLPDNSVDLVVTFETIEHVKDYKQFIKEINRVLKQDGLAIVSTPNDEEFAEGNHFHLHEFKYNELHNLLAKSFTYQKPYFQATWSYVQISDEKFIQTNNASKNIEVHNYAPLKPEKYLYFYILCSNRKISETVDDIGGLGGHYSARELGDIFAHYKKQISDHEQVLDNEKDAHNKTKIRLMMREGENNAILQSSSYKIARKLASTKTIAKYGIGQIRAANPKTRLMLASNRRRINSGYRSPEFTDAFTEDASSDLAVIIHLYYEDMLPYFKEKLGNIRSMNHDTYITIPDKGNTTDTIKSIKEALPTARIAIVPNGGRDILPFVQVIKHIQNKGYTKILKLHSKKSPHRADGSAWRDKIIDSLLPSETSLLVDINNTLNKKDTALVGPAGEYVSLLVNLSATAHYIKSLSRKVASRLKSDMLMRYPDEYGFFAGSMFWARMDAIQPLIDIINTGAFEPELGQQDSTLAHALERMISIAPELAERHMYEVGEEIRVREVAYHTSNIPSWSELHR